MISLVRLFVIPVLILLVACDAEEGVTVQPLPPLDLPSPEARAGLPEVEGLWHFAGWEVPSEAWLGDTTAAPLGAVNITIQRLDSLGGYYGTGDTRIPLFGEVRRDSVVSLAVPPTAGSGYLAGMVQQDTLWVRLTSLGGSALWSAGARAAFVRGAVGTPFVRLPGGRVPVDATDTTTVVPPEVQPAPAEPIVGAPQARPEPEQPVRPTPQEERAPRPQEPTKPKPKPAPKPAAPEPAPQPEPEPEPEPAPRKPKLLGVPAPRVDTAAVSPPGPGVDIPPR